MAHTKLLPQEVLESVAQQIGERLGIFSSNTDFFILESGDPQPGVDLGESFEVWSLPPDALEEAAKGFDISDIARSTGVWHHQIRSNKEALSFARSKPLGATADSWSLRELFVSPLAEDFGRAIDWVEANVPAQAEVRYLNLPAFQVDAFWIVIQQTSPEYAEWNNKLVIIRVAASSDLKPLDVLSSQQFFAALQEEGSGAGLR